MADDAGIADCFIQGALEQLPEGRLRRAYIESRPRFARGDDRAEVGELLERSVGWLQEVLTREGGQPAMLDRLPTVDENIRLRVEQIRTLRRQTGGQASRRLAMHAAEAHEAFENGELCIAAKEAGACFYLLLASREERDTTIYHEALREADDIVGVGGQSPS